MANTGFCRVTAGTEPRQDFSRDAGSHGWERFIVLPVRAARESGAACSCFLDSHLDSQVPTSLGQSPSQDQICLRFSGHFIRLLRREPAFFLNPAMDQVAKSVTGDHRDALGTGEVRNEQFTKGPIRPVQAWVVGPILNL